MFDYSIPALMTKLPIYINPVSDFGFKFLFGSTANKELLIALLNSLFHGKKTISDIVYNRNEHVGDSELQGGIVFDLSCTGNDGEKFVIEVQRSSRVNLKRRMLYYGSKLISDQAPKGRRQLWNYTLSEVYVIVLLDTFSLTDKRFSERYFYDICLCDRVTGDVFYKDLCFIYIELTNFTKEADELTSDLDEWLYILKYLESLDHQPIYLQKPIFDKLFSMAEYSKLSMEDKKMYDISQKRLWDEESVRQYREQQLEESNAKGLKQGLEKGRAEGKQNLLDIARRMKEAGMAADDIVTFTQLPISDIESL